MPNTEKVYTDFAQTRLEEAISDSDLSCLIIDEPAQLFSGWASGTEFYLTLVDAATNREIVKVTGISDKWLTVSRGQQGTSARAWPIGTLIEQRPTADDMSAFIQKEGFRTIAYNPNGVLGANYPGEKIYQTDAGACKKRWWKNVSGSNWRLIAGTMCDGEIVDDDPASPTYGYVIYYPWVSYFDNTCWDPRFVGYGTWDGSKWISGFAGGHYGFNQDAQGAWYVGYRPTKMKITFSGVPAVSLCVFDANNDIMALYDTCNYTSEAEITLSWGAHDLAKFTASTDGCGTENEWYITNIEFSEE